MTVGAFAAKLGTGEMAETDPKTMQDLTSVVREGCAGPRRAGPAGAVTPARQPPVPRLSAPPCRSQHPGAPTLALERASPTISLAWQMGKPNPRGGRRWPEAALRGSQAPRPPVPGRGSRPHPWNVSRDKLDFASVLWFFS